MRKRPRDILLPPWTTGGWGFRRTEASHATQRRRIVRCRRDKGKHVGFALGRMPFEGEL